jgi:undecaprenyl-diphosphatase
MPFYDWDDQLFMALNALAGRWPWLDSLARLWLNDYFVPTLLATMLLALWFEGSTPAERQLNQRAVLVGALSAALANLWVKGLNQVYYRPRPFAAHAVTLLFYRPTDSSLPSNAAALGFSIALGVWFYQRRWGGVMLVIATLFGLSRIVGGVHYPLDVVAGAFLGGASAWLIHHQPRLQDYLLHLIIGLTHKLGLV